ncbi:TPA_asm: hypothetical protein, partial [ssRNA phage SRR5466729_1]
MNYRRLHAKADQLQLVCFPSLPRKGEEVVCLLPQLQTLILNDRETT